MAGPISAYRHRSGLDAEEPGGKACAQQQKHARLIRLQEA
jgi:hypothetical protein